MTNQTLFVLVGEPVGEALSRTADMMSSLERGQSVVPRFEVGFADVGQMTAVFTPRRWELLAVLGKAGPVSIAALAKLLQRDYKNVHGDVSALMEWMAIEKDKQGRVFAPFSDIHIDIRLPERQAA